MAGPSEGGGRRGDAGGDFRLVAGGADATGGRFGGADGVLADFAGVEGDVMAVFASDAVCAFDAPTRITGVVLAAGFAATRLGAATGVRTLAARARFTIAFLAGAFLAGVRAVADFTAAGFAADRWAVAFFEAFFASRPTGFFTAFFTAFFAGFFTAGRDATVRVAAAFPVAFFADFVAAFFVAFFAAALRAGAFFIALPLRIQDTAPRVRMASSPDYQCQPLPSLSTWRSVNPNRAR